MADVHGSGGIRKKGTESVADGKGTVCAICLQIIIERSNVSDGEDSIFCEGACQRWLHRSCAGLPDPAFDLIRNSDESFYCFPCAMAVHKSEVKELRSVVDALSKELTDLKSSIASPVVNNQLLYSDVVSFNSDNAGSSTARAATPLAPGALLPRAPRSGPPLGDPSSSGPRSPSMSKASGVNDRKYNIVIHGLAECPKGTPRRDRISMDEQAIVESIKPQVSLFSPLNIRDCFRLGSYVEDNVHPRPILATLTRASDVSLVLSKRFSNGIYVKPDLSPEVRHAQYILRKERNSLIAQSNVDRKSISIRGSHIYIGERLHGRVMGGALVCSDSLGNHAPALESLAGPDTGNDLATSSSDVSVDTEPYQGSQ